MLIEPMEKTEVDYRFRITLNDFSRLVKELIQLTTWVEHIGDTPMPSYDWDDYEVKSVNCNGHGFWNIHIRNIHDGKVTICGLDSYFAMQLHRFMGMAWMRETNPTNITTNQVAHEFTFRFNRS